MRVLGYGKLQLLTLTLAAGLVLGLAAGLAGSCLVYCLVNVGGGMKIPVGFFRVFEMPPHCLWWGTALGSLTAVLGGAIPVCRASTANVSEALGELT